MKKTTLLLLAGILLIPTLVYSFNLNPSTTPPATKITTLVPAVSFVNPTNNQTIGGKITFRLAISQAKEENILSVELFAKKENQTNSFFIGSAQKSNQNWSLGFNSASLPDGHYFIYPKISIGGVDKNCSGIKINIYNKPIVNGMDKEKSDKESIVKIGEIAAEKTKEIDKASRIASKKIVNIIKNSTTTRNNENLGNKTKINSFVSELATTTKQIVKKTIAIKEKEKEAGKIDQKIKGIEKELKAIKNNEKKVKKDYRQVISGMRKEREEKLNREVANKKKIKEEINKNRENIKNLFENKKLIEKKIKKEAEQLTGNKGFSAKEKEISKIINNLNEEVSQKEKERQKYIKEITKDSDGDGLSDIEEIRIGTNPFNPDSDNDGYLDGVEVKNGFDPLSSAVQDKISYQLPDKSKAPTVDRLKVEKVEEIIDSNGNKKLRIEGKGLPNAFVVIYLYSQPVVLITKTDDNGNFLYVLNKPLENGVHRVYVAITDNRGKIIEKSSSFNFLKTPVAVAAILPQNLPGEVISPAASMGKYYFFGIAGLVVVALLIAVYIIGFVGKKKKI